MGFATFVSLGSLRPHLANVLEDHIHVAIEGLDSPENLAVVATINEDLTVGLDSLG
jgi:hypothetical protein